MNRMTVVAVLIVVTALAAAVPGADCPRFRGPAGDGQFPETGLLKQWPAGGPKVAWTAKGLGQGYSSATVANGTVYVTGMDDQKQGYLFAFGLDGSPKWKTAYGPELEKRGPAVAGTRGTPTIDGDRVFLVTGLGKLVTFDAAKGQVLKTVDLLERFGGKPAQFGFAESVLVDGQKLICTPGGPDASLAALDKNTGEVLWRTKGLSQPTGLLLGSDRRAGRPPAHPDHAGAERCRCRSGHRRGRLAARIPAPGRGAAQSAAVWRWAGLRLFRHGSRRRDVVPGGQQPDCGARNGRTRPWIARCRAPS